MPPKTMNTMDMVVFFINMLMDLWYETGGWPSTGIDSEQPCKLTVKLSVAHNTLNERDIHLLPA